MRTQWERDAKVRFRISLPSFEKIDSQIPELKKADLRIWIEKVHWNNLKFDHNFNLARIHKFR